MDGEEFLFINAISVPFQWAFLNIVAWFFSSWTWEFFRVTLIFFGILAVCFFLMAVFIDG